MKYEGPEECYSAGGASGEGGWADGARTNVIETYAPIHDPSAAKTTYAQFFV